MSNNRIWISGGILTRRFVLERTWGGSRIGATPKRRGRVQRALQELS